MAGVDQQQLELGLAPGNLVAEPFNGNAGGGGVLRIDVQGSKVHLAAGVAEAVPAEVNDQRVGRARFLSHAGNSMVRLAFSGCSRGLIDWSVISRMFSGS